MPPKYVNTAKFEATRRDRHIEGEVGIWMKVQCTGVRLLVLAATDANPAFVDLFPKMQAELRRLEGVGADKDEIDTVRARYYTRMFVRDWGDVEAADGGPARFSVDACTEYLAYSHDSATELAETVFETRRFRMALAQQTVEDLKAFSDGTAPGEST